MSVVALSNQDFREVLSHSQLAVVDVYAQWCGPCLSFAPVFEAMSQRYPHLDFFSIDAEESPDFRKWVEIPVLPFVVAFLAGRFLKSESLSTQVALKNFLDTLPTVQR